jgi:hypothetical protein
MDIWSPPTRVWVKASKLLHCRVQRICHVIGFDIIAVAIEDVFVDRLCWIFDLLFDWIFDVVFEASGKT